MIVKRLLHLFLALWLAAAGLAPAQAQLATLGAGKALATASGPCSGSFQLCDTFSLASKDTSKWSTATGAAAMPGWDATLTYAGTDTEGSGVVILTPTISGTNIVGRISLATNITLVGREMVMTMPVAPNTTGAVSFGYSQTGGRSGQNARWNIDNNFGSLTIQAAFSNFGSGGTQANVAYNSTNHQCFRIRATVSDFFWETSPAGCSTWTVQRQLTVDGGTPGTYFSPSSGDVGVWTHNYNSNATPLVPQISDFWVTN